MKTYYSLIFTICYLLCLSSNNVYAQASALYLESPCGLVEENKRIQSKKAEITFTPYYTQMQRFEFAEEYQKNILFVAESKGSYALGEHLIIPIEGECSTPYLQFTALGSRAYPELIDGVYDLNFKKAVVAATVHFGKKGQIILLPIFIDNLENYGDANRPVNEWYSDDHFKIKVFKAIQKYAQGNFLSDDEFQALQIQYKKDFEAREQKREQARQKHAQRKEDKEKLESLKNNELPKARYTVSLFDGQLDLGYDAIELLKKDTKIYEESMTIGNMVMETKNSHDFMLIQLKRADVPILNIEIIEGEGYFFKEYQFLEEGMDAKVKALENEMPQYFKNALREILIADPIFKNKNVFDWSKILKVEPVTTVNSEYDDYSPMLSANEEVLFFLRKGDPENSMTMFPVSGNYNKPLHFNQLGQEYIDQLRANGQDTRENRRNLLKEQQRQHTTAVKKMRRETLQKNNALTGESVVSLSDTDILYSTKFNGKFLGVQQQDFPLNDWSSNFFIGVSADGKRIYTKSIYMGNEYTINTAKDPEEVYYVEYEKTSYNYIPTGNIIEFEKAHNAFQVSYILTQNNNAMICGFQGDDTKGGMDIYISFRQKNGQFEYPVNLGPNINSKWNEYNPYLAADLKTLYFIKDTDVNESKIYISRRLDETWKKWTTPVALPAPINTPNSIINDLFITANGKTLYFSSNRKTGKDYDIYAVQLDDFLAAIPADVIKGNIVINENKLKDVQVEVQAFDKLSKATKDVSYAITNPNGGFEVPFREKEKVVIKAKKEGYISDVVISENKEMSNTELNMTKLEKGNRFTLKNILFERSSATFSTSSFHDLENLKTVLEDNPNLQILIEGHTDFIKTANTDLSVKAQKAQQLSKKRAIAVRDYLIQNGIAGHRLKVKGYGGTKPLFSNDTEKGRKKNRRVEIVVL